MNFFPIVSLKRHIMHIGARAKIHRKWCLLDMTLNFSDEIDLPSAYFTCLQMFYMIMENILNIARPISTLYSNDSTNAKLQ